MIFVHIMKTGYRVLCIAALAGVFLPAFVFAAPIESSGFVRAIGVAFQDGRLIGIRAFQLFWLVTFFIAGGLVIWSFLRFRNSEDDLFEHAKSKKILLISSIAAAFSLVMVLVLGLVYWGIERSLTREMPKSTESEQTVQKQTPLADFGEVEKIETTYPSPNQKNVPRNTAILVTFKDPIDPKSISADAKTLLKDSVKILPSGSSAAALDAKVEFSNSDHTVKIVPTTLLGELNKRVFVSVKLTKSVLSASGAPLFSDGREYSWQFEVSGFIDDTPPFVESVVPLPLKKGSSEKIPPNSLIQITFSEPIDPTTVSPRSLEVRGSAGTAVIPGTVSLGNNFRTLTFTAAESCGTNACSETVFCLPKSSGIAIRLHAAKLSTDKSSGPNKGAFPYDGIVDTAGNSLDGGGEQGISRNAKSAGSPADDYLASFATGDTLDLTQPAIYSINPGRDMTRISKTAGVEIVFTKFMDLQSLHTGSIRIQPPMNYTVVSTHDFNALRSKAVLQHDEFKENTTYSPEVLSEVRDASQNCFSQCIGPTK